METSNPASAFPRLIPVLDILGGQVVRAVGGRRSEYRPVRSVLTDSTDPGVVAKALVAATGAEWLYVADLDAITGGRADVGSVGCVVYETRRPILLDAGFRSAAETDRYAGLDIPFVVGTETGSLATIGEFEPGRCVLSLDLFNGKVLGDERDWGGTDPLPLVARAVSLGVETVILLDLARVGAGTGAGTETLVAATKRHHPDVGVIAGGGVRTWDDVIRLGDAGAGAVLVASALHDGTIRGRPPSGVA